MEHPQDRPRTGRRPKPTAERYDRRLLVKFTPAQWAQVQTLIAIEGFCPASVYVRRLLLQRAATVLPRTLADESQGA